jgi:type II secretory ATPase GspE/PulE/Tfp pilus assembly ATPase PilB-like protein
MSAFPSNQAEVIASLANAVPAASTWGRRLAALDASSGEYATRFVALLLEAAGEVGVSDVHLQPVSAGLDIRWRLDGVLQQLGVFPRGLASDVVNRLKVLAELLTYRTDVPQEGRLRRDPNPAAAKQLTAATAGSGAEVRISTFPTVHGERLVIRRFAGAHALQRLNELGYPASIAVELGKVLHETSGLIVVAGPAGSGKTTTAYALLRELVARHAGGRSLVSLEDPVEVAIDGVSQSQVNPTVGFDLTQGLRSLLRQDPEVILVGEIRDRATAETTLQASLTGHLVLTTFHAGSAVTAISRLLELGIEPYLLRSGLLGIVCQRLVRRLCECKQTAEAATIYARELRSVWRAVGCTLCQQTGYRGRMVLAEWLRTENSELGRAILSREDANRLQELALRAGLIPLRQRADEAIEGGLTTPAEILRVLGGNA